MGISGLGVTALAAGSLLIYAGIRNAPILGSLRDIAAGRAPTAYPATPASVTFTAPSSTGTGGVQTAGLGGPNAAIADAARRYLGAPYVWAAAGPTTFDCSGLVSYVLIHDIGLRIRRMVTTEFLVWTGARTIGRDDCAAGDLVCWSSHIGIATGRDTMIHAPTAGDVVKESRIWGVPAPVIRRVILPGGAAGKPTVTV